jgi:hypothetical protein
MDTLKKIYIYLYNNNNNNNSKIKKVQFHLVSQLQLEVTGAKTALVYS